MLALQFRRFRREDNSGVFVRFPDPRSMGYFNEAYVGVHFGFEMQIDDHAAPVLPRLPGRVPQPAHEVAHGGVAAGARASIRR